MLKYLFITVLLQGVLGSFSNEVVYPDRTADGIYRFVLEVTEGLTMAYWNSSRGTYQVVVNVNGSYYIRDRRTSSACAAVIPIDQSIVDSIVKGAGHHKEMLFVNRSFPGPPIVVPLNAKVQITVRNQMMTDVLSMHWHGISQYNTFYMDGVTRVTQCPIGPGDSFVYEFKATDIGTHW